MRGEGLADLKGGVDERSLQQAAQEKLRRELFQQMQEQKAAKAEQLRKEKELDEQVCVAQCRACTSST